MFSWNSGRVVGKSYESAKLTAPTGRTATLSETASALTAPPLRSAQFFAVDSSGMARRQGLRFRQTHRGMVGHPDANGRADRVR